MNPDLKKLLDLLGAEDLSAAQAMIATFNAFLSDIQAASGTDNLNEARANVRATFASLRDIDKATGKTGAESIEAAMDWKQGAADAAVAQAALQQILPEAALAALGPNPTLSSLVGAVSAQHKQRATDEATAKIDQAVKDGRLKPAARSNLDSIYSKFGPDALNAAIAALPEPAKGSVPSTDPAPSQAPVDGETLDDADLAVAKAMGITPAQALKNKNDWVKASAGNEREVRASA